MQGIDVAGQDGRVDWTAVKNSGKTFAFVKATEGASVKDPTFARHWPTMKAAGIIRGAYHFFHPRTSDPVVQAQEFLKTIGKLEPGDLPPVLDIEVTDNVNDPKLIINAAKQWLVVVEKALLQQTGKPIKPIIYTYPGFWEGLGNPTGFAEYQLWIAHYDQPQPTVPTTWQGEYLIHQFREDVSGVPGVSGKADLNRFKDLQPGDSGLRVKNLQQQLTAIGLYTGAIDGKFSSAVKDAVISFQSSKGLQADGIVGIKTWLSLLWI
ncbi:MULTISPECIES: GH25 family lysozyme [unclassified Tolypothrix]|uniref:GH25 family lysozyme n=1 Tax=unclassified Tolypothrix TaxID=2649714 RepID=UPI0005EAA668|nr:MULTISPECIES: GH25 family lysozyme [unclassified Tolypothrix]BAY90616.1 glycoside hydrolase family protein [Microchaete diplosiphon NIES-3275]EKF01222.1 glycosyl hydrolase family 25 [Tolypothrix sp. PCC 7601]MBE9086092.1 peptidoglycan-binding protein [Tolypothrix sp. LEGE 11397]UYD24768.1 peptidoglycan-binding protein [Tolypothrix sp. PCC 7712]UYD33001.1 peptidoglycan-binding protein [Tolypothrix sp. PCC 7601]